MQKCRAFGYCRGRLGSHFAGGPWHSNVRSCGASGAGRADAGALGGPGVAHTVPHFSDVIFFSRSCSTTLRGPQRVMLTSDIGQGGRRDKQT
eukprot:4815276-Prymnesium_polylepis.1